MNTTTQRALPLLGALLMMFPLLAAAAVGRTPGVAWVTPAGAAAYSVPLALPPGTAGLTPALSLDYRHNQHGGLLGVGWSLGGLSQISRCPRTDAQDGAAAPVQYSLQDRFCLDGQRLVVVNGAAYGTVGSEYRTEIESYARIRAHGAAGAGPQHFTVESADGRVLEYGATADSRIDAGGRVVSGVATPRTWALNRIRDRAGNVVDFRYLEDAARFSHRIESVRYNGNPSLGIATSHEVRFVWESRPAGEVDLTYVAGTPVRQVVRLDRVDVLHEGQLVRRYDLSYQPALSSAGRSRLASIQECGVGGSDCLAPTTLQWQDGVPGLGPEAAVPLTISSAPAGDLLPYWITADINGDGHDDLLWTSGASGSSTLRYRLGGPNGLGPEVNAGILAQRPGVPFDYDGDGRADLLTLTATNQWSVIPGTASGPGSPIHTGYTAGSYIDFRGVDLNGDGRGDIAWSELVGHSQDIAVRVRYALPGGGFSPTPVTVYEQGTHTGYEWPEGGYFLGQPGQRIDLDGDGREDLLMDERYSVARITASGVSSEGFDGQPAGALPLDLNGDDCTDLAYRHFSGRWRVRYGSCGGLAWAAPEVEGPAWSGSLPAQVLDWNGDGQQDLLLRGASTWQVMLSAGDRFLPVASTGIALGTLGSTVFADVNGDGLDDLLAIGAGELRYRLHAGPRPDLLASVTDGFGASAAFDYAPLTRPEAYTRASGASWPQRDVQDARPVVVALTLSDGSGNARSTRYAYEGLRFDQQGRGSLGFALRVSTDTTAGATLRTEESWRQDFPYTGLPQARTLRQASGRAIVEKSWLYAQLALGSDAAMRRRPYLSSSTERYFEAGGAYDGVHHTTRAYSVAQVDANSGLVLDASWSTTEHATGHNAGASRTQRLLHTGVLNDSAQWCLGRPLGAQLIESHTLAGGNALTRTAAMSWDSLRCRPTQQQLEPASNQWQLSTALGYDAFGNVSSVAVTGAGMPPRTTRIDWGARGSAPAAITDPLSQVERLAWDAGRGLLLSRTDANGLVTSWTYDALGRPATELRPDRTRTVITLSDCAAGTDCGDPAARYRLRRSEQSPSAVTQWFEERSFDSLDRWVVHREQQASGALSTRSRRFDARGRLLRENLPHWQGAAAGHLQFAYDLLDRPTGVGLHAASGALQRSRGVEYRGLALTERDALGRSSTRTATAWGDVVSAVDTAGGEMRYRYDAAGRLLQVVDAYGDTVATLGWNLRGMKVSQADAALGQWTFTPNALGELVAQRDALGQQVAYTYDLLSRPLTRSEPEGTTTWTWGLPADNTASSRVAGRLRQVVGPGYAEQYVYDALSRLSRQMLYADVRHDFSYGYNAMGQLDSLTYPAIDTGYRLRLGYEYAHGQLTRIRDYNAPANTFWKLEAADAAGRVLDETRGANLRVITGVNPATGEIEYRQAGIGGGSAQQNLAWRWDAQGNMVERKDLNRGITESFSYDALGRLDDVRRNGVLTLDLAYDLAGNPTSRSDVGSYAYDQARKHAVTAAGAYRYAYDANGNMTSRNGARVSWTSYNLPRLIEGQGGTGSMFWYGADRQRWKQVATWGGTNETTIYLGGLMEKVTRGSTTTWRHYVPSPGGMAALHLRSNAGVAAQTWLLTQDALGSTDRIVDSSGVVALATSFDAFGKRRAADWSSAPGSGDILMAARTTRLGFTGHEQLDHIGLVHMSGRVYDPVIGRFLSPDPVIQAPYWGQDLNRYSYAWNNPLSIVDPTGYTEEVPCLMEQGRCAQVNVHGLRDGQSFGIAWGELWGAWMRSGSLGQPVSAWERDPCGQDGSAMACRSSGRDVGPPAPISTVASVSLSPSAEFPARGADYYAARTLEWIGYTLIAFDLANTATGVLVGPDTGLLGAPLVAAAVQLRSGAGSGSKALQTYWPPSRGFMGPPTRGVLKPGSRIDRYGSELGTFASPAGTPFGARALPPQAVTAPLRQYEVLRPLPVREGAAAPWFGQPGGGIQYELAHPIETLIQQGFLKRIP